MKLFPQAVPLLVDYLSESSRRFSDKVALVAGEERLTYAEIERLSNSLAHALRDRGVGHNDRVMVFGSNCAESVISFWAALKTGATVSMVGPQVKKEKLAFLIGDFRPKALIASAFLYPEFAVPATGSPQVETVVIWGKIDSKKMEAVPRAETWRQAINAHSGETPLKRTNIDIDLACVIYTSGSTGDPKGVMLTHRNMLTAATSISNYLEMQSDDVVLCVLPLSFDYGLYQMIMCFRLGARLVLEPSFSYTARVLSIMGKENVTGFPGVPTIFAMMESLKNLGDYDFSSVRFISNTAAALMSKHIRFLKKTFPQARIYSMYGLTECKRISYLPPEDLDRKPDSVGVPIPNTEFWVVDEQNRRLGPNQVGQLVVRGATVMAGYWNRQEETSKTLRPGPLPGERVLYTGDYAKIDEEGYLYFVGRIDDIIKSRGEKVAPKEVERILIGIPGVKEAAVIGVPDEILDQAIKAFVVLEPGVQLCEKEILHVCKRDLEGFMVPKIVVIVSDLPKNSSGKIQKSALS